MKNKHLSFVLAVLMSMATSVASAHDFEVDGIYYITSSSSPYTVAVTYRGDEYYSYSDRYTGSVTIPESVTYNSKTYSVTSIGSEAFYSCTGLTSVSIPNSVISIGSYAFKYCSGLTKVEFASIESLCRISFANYYDNPLSYAHHLYIDGTEVTDLVIPNSVTSIGNYTFYGCSGLTSVTIPNSVTTIDYAAFYNCQYLTTITCLNPVPPTCAGLSTFICSTDYVRDKYDVYTYATLHVPMGSKEAYSSAYEWRYFNKIKEDMESNGKVFYANLTVKQGTTGYTRQAIKADENYTLYIGSLSEHKVNCITFNGMDVTDEIVDGYYTTPEIKGESVLSISYEKETPVEALSAPSNIRVRGYDGVIYIDNIDTPSDVQVYTADGKLVGQASSAFGSTDLSVTPEQLYIVKVGKRTYKIAL